MKKLKYIILIILINNYLFAQDYKNEIIGNWIKFKIEKKDGSKLMKRYYADSTLIKFSVDDKQLCKIHLFPSYNKDCLSYKFENNELIISEYAKYTIEYIKNDTLYLLENIIDKLDYDKDRYCFVRESIILNKIEDENKNKKNIVANTYYSPNLKSDFQKIFIKELKSDICDLKLIGSMLIYVNEHKIETKITYFSSSKNKIIEKITNLLNNSFDSWALEKFKQYETIEIPFALKMTYTEMFKGINLCFHTKSLNDLDFHSGPTLKALRESGDYFNKGIEAYKKMKYKLAIDYFLKSYQANPENIDALYNKANLYYELNNKEESCKDYKTLIDLGQKAAETLYEERCKN